MTIRMRDDILANQITYYNGLIAKHKQNVEIYLNNPVGIGEHPDVMAAIEAEVTSIAQAHEKICLLYTSPSPRDRLKSRMPSSA